MDGLKLLDGRLKLRHLIFVDALTRHESVNGAAAALHITQPVATRTLRNLEAILGVSLYERGPRGLTPTIFGKTFTKDARLILSQLSQAGRHVTELAGADGGNVVVGVDPAGSNVFLRQAIAELKNEHPRLTVTVREGSAKALSAELEAGGIDLIVGRPGASGTENEVYIPLFDERVGIFVRAEHPLTRRSTIAVADLGEFPWVIPGVESAFRNDIAQLFTGQAMPLPANRIEVTSCLAVRQLLLQTDGLALLPGLIGDNDPDLHALPISLEPAGHTVGITASATRTVHPGATALMQALQTVTTECLGGEAADDFQTSTDGSSGRYRAS